MIDYDRLASLKLTCVIKKDGSKFSNCSLGFNRFGRVFDKSTLTVCTIDYDRIEWKITCHQKRSLKA